MQIKTFTGSLLAGLMTLSLMPVHAEENDASTVAKIVEIQHELFNGPHKGLRSVHAKGVVLKGDFYPADTAAQISSAEHFNGNTTPIVVRFSNGTGIPDIADDDPKGLIKGMAVRFSLQDDEHTDLVLSSVPRFPAATPKDFLAFMTAVKDSANSDESPTPLQKYIQENPAAKAFAEYPKPVPPSFAALSYHSINAFQFTNEQGETVYGRYIVEPAEDEKMLGQEVSGEQDKNYLMNEIRERLPRDLVRFHLKLQIANEGDEVNDATVIWPEDRQVVELGTIIIEAVRGDALNYERETMFNPLALPEGIEPTQDPILLARPAAYAVSFQHR
ncbi:MAG: catalase family peroxidase [Gammaproteobacteria bacterium]|nr:catalase family peroxidase [Gammaproteobacteria bacterium]